MEIELPLQRGAHLRILWKERGSLATPPRLKSSPASGAAFCETGTQSLKQNNKCLMFGEIGIAASPWKACLLRKQPTLDLRSWIADIGSWILVLEAFSHTPGGPKGAANL